MTNTIPRTDQEHDPVFICGIARSGTSYLRSLLNSSPDIHLSFEGRMLKEGIQHSKKIKNDPRAEDVGVFLDQLIVSESETNRNKELIQVVEENREALTTFAMQHSYAEIMREIYGMAFQSRIWGDKLLRVEYAWPILKVWPDARFILLFRDPRAVASSQQQRRETPICVTAGYWNTHYKLCQKLAAEIPAQVITLKYEVLVQQFSESLGSLFHFLGLSGQVDVEWIKSQKPPQTDTLHKWKHLLPQSHIGPLEKWCHQGMCELEYEPLYGFEPQQMSRARYFWGLLRHHWRSGLNLGLVRRKRLLSRLKTMIREQ